MKKINIVCPVNQLGYGIVSTNIVKEIAKKLDVFLWPIGQIDKSINDYQFFEDLNKKSDFYDKDAPSLKIWHQNDLSMHPSKGIRTALPIFELEPLQKHEVHQMNCMDIIFLPTQWAVDIAINSGVKTKIFKTPFGVDHSIFDKPKQALNKNKFTFLNVGKWEIRKGHDILIKAFQKAFPSDNDVELIMHCDNPFLNEEERNNWESYYSSDKRIKISHRFKTQQELFELMSYADCGVFPARAEGWNMELAEMLSMGKNCIATNATAHKEFVNNEICELINVDKLVKAYDNKWFFGQGYWPNLDDNFINQFASKMAKVKNLKNNFNKKAYDEMKKLTWEKTASLITDYIYGN